MNYLGSGRLGEQHLLAHPVRNYDGESGVHVWAAHAERPWWGVNCTDHDVPIETWLLPPHSVSVNPGTEGGAVVWKSPVTGTVRITGRLTDADPHDGNGVVWMVDHAIGGVRRSLSSGVLPNGASKKLAQGKYPERLASVQVKAGDEIILGVALRTGDAHYDITNIELTITRLDALGEWELGSEARSDFLAGNPQGVWAYYDMAGSFRLRRMPAVDAALKEWDKAVANKIDRAALSKVARQLQQAIDKGGADGPVAQALTGSGSPYRADNQDDAKYLAPAAQATVAKLSADLQRLRASVPPLPCSHGVQQGGLRYGLFPGTQDARIHVRGSYSRLGDRVPRRFPRSLAGDGQPPITSGSGRLELANWIASPNNPLTARVMVNRIWQHHFGEGIVRTPSNFGAMGSTPTHPELLDYLAQQFIASGWSVKAMHRMILLSATYQQSSKVTPESLRFDPNNLLFDHMNRRQLEAEALRDSLLAVCGCLDTRPGGPAEQGPGSLRRMLYLRISRSDKSGLAAVFDGADAAIQVEKRTASTVAPQALLLMNSPLVVEKVGLLVQRPEVVAAKTPEERIQVLYSLLFGRRASVEEEKIGCRFIEALTATPAPAKAGDAVPLGPWEAYAQALLMSNEFLFVD
jgi:hypothetical protein